MTVAFEIPWRAVDRVFIHCSASDKAELRGEKLYDWVARIHVEQNKWDDIGYHFLIDKRGTLIPARNIETKPAAQAFHNEATIAIMVHGLHYFTAESLDTLYNLCQAINTAYRGRVTFHGHCEVNAKKTCPVFSYKSILQLDAWSRMPAPGREPHPKPKREDQVCP